MQLPVPAGEPIYTGRGCDSPDKVNPVSALRSSLIHLNNAGSALPSTHTLSTQVDYLIRESQIGGYEAFTEYADDLHAVHTQVGALVNCPSEQVALVESATVGWDRALQAIAHDDPLEPGDRILVASSEYASNVIPLMQLANKTGAQLEFIPDGPDGGVDVEAFAGTLDERVRIVSITHAPSHNGVVNDIVGIGDALRFNGSPAWYLVDACQSAGQLPLDFSRIGCDALSATGRKFIRGPRGTGFVAASQRMLNDLEPFPLDLHSATWTGPGSYRVRSGARRFETWEASYAAILALGCAVQEILDVGIDVIHAAISARAEQLRLGLAELPGVQVRDRGKQRSGIVTATMPAPGAAAVVTQLRDVGVNTSLSTADYAPIDFAEHEITEQVRLSPHTYISEDDIDQAVTRLQNILQ